MSARILAVGVPDPGGPTAAQLCCRFRAAGHESFRMVAAPETVHHWSDRLVASWTGRTDDLPRPPDVLVEVHEPGAVDALAAARRRFPTASVCRGSSPVVDLADRLATVLHLDDADLEVPRVLGMADRATELATFLATDGPVMLKHRGGPGAPAAHYCGGIDELTARARTMAAAASGSGGWYLEEFLPGDDVVVAGVFRGGEPLCWGALRPGDGGPPELLEAADAVRPLELASDAAAALALDGPARLALRRQGNDARVVAVVPGATIELLCLSSYGPDDAVVASLVDPDGVAAPVTGGGRAPQPWPLGYRVRSRVTRRS